MKVQAPSSRFQTSLGFFAAVWPTLPLFAAPGSESTNALPELSPPYAELPPAFWEQHGSAILLVAMGVVALALLMVWLRLRPGPKIILPPAEQARNELAALRQRPEDGALLSSVSRILRRYFSSAFQISAGEMTTSELCRALSVSEVIGGELAAQASDFLRRCDEQKFSPNKSTTALDAVNQAQSLVEVAEAHRMQTEASTRPRA